MGEWAGVSSGLLAAVNPDGQSFDGGFLGFRTLFSYFGGQFLGVA